MPFANDGYTLTNAGSSTTWLAPVANERSSHCHSCLCSPAIRRYVGTVSLRKFRSLYFNDPLMSSSSSYNVNFLGMATPGDETIVKLRQAYTDLYNSSAAARAVWEGALALPSNSLKSPLSPLRTLIPCFIFSWLAETYTIECCLSICAIFGLVSYLSAMYAFHFRPILKSIADSYQCQSAQTRHVGCQIHSESHAKSFEISRECAQIIYD